VSSPDRATIFDRLNSVSRGPVKRLVGCSFLIIFAFFVCHFIVVGASLKPEFIVNTVHTTSKTEISAMPNVKNIEVVNKPKNIQSLFVFGELPERVFGENDLLFCVFRAGELRTWRDDTTAWFLREILPERHIVWEWLRTQIHVVFESCIPSRAFAGIIELEDNGGGLSNLKPSIGRNPNRTEPRPVLYMDLATNNSELIYSGECQDGSKHDYRRGERKFYLFVKSQLLPFLYVVLFVVLQVVSTVISLSCMVFGDTGREYLFGFVCFAFSLVCAHYGSLRSYFRHPTSAITGK
jgi:hypothetical protein